MAIQLLPSPAVPLNTSLETAFPTKALPVAEIELAEAEVSKVLAGKPRYVAPPVFGGSISVGGYREIYCDDKPPAELLNPKVTEPIVEPIIEEPVEKP